MQLYTAQHSTIIILKAIITAAGRRHGARRLQTVTNCYKPLQTVTNRYAPLATATHAPLQNGCPNGCDGLPLQRAKTVVTASRYNRYNRPQRS